MIFDRLPRLWHAATIDFQESFHYRFTLGKFLNAPSDRPTFRRKEGKGVLRAPIFFFERENKNGTIRIYRCTGRLITEADTTAIDSNIDGVLYACHPSMPFAIVPLVADGQISFQFRRLYEVSLQ